MRPDETRGTSPALLMPALLLLVLLVGGASVPAAADDLQLPPGKWWENQHLAERLQLTAEQQQQIKDLVFEHARRMIDLTADIKRSELELKQLADESEFDADQVRKAYHRFQQARTALDTDRFELLLSIRQVLKAEQWRALRKLRDDVRDRFPGGGPGPGQRPGGMGPRPGLRDRVAPPPEHDPG